MEVVKRIEIMASSVELSKILKGLEKSGVPGYTVIRNVAGRSLRGTSSDDLSNLDNVYVIAFCSTEQVDTVTENVSPILNKFGGVCFVSDAMQMNVVRCVGS